MSEPRAMNKNIAVCTDSHKRTLRFSLTYQAIGPTSLVFFTLCSTPSRLSLWARPHGLLTTVRKTRAHNPFPQTAFFPEPLIQTPMGHWGSHASFPGSLSAQTTLLLSPSFPAHRLTLPSSESFELQSCQLFSFSFLPTSNRRQSLADSRS